MDIYYCSVLLLLLLNIFFSFFFEVICSFFHGKLLGCAVKSKVQRHTEEKTVNFCLLFKKLIKIFNHSVSGIILV